MATPIIQSTGSVSGAGVVGQGRNNLVPGEIVTLSDVEGANLGAVYFWVFDDVPIGTSPVLLNHTTATPSFTVPADATKAGSYRIRCTVNGAFTSVEVIAVPLTTTGARIPSFEEETEYDQAGNVKGWHEALTGFMRAVDTGLGNAGATAFERTAAAVVPNGTNSTTLQLGVAVYPGSLLAIGLGAEAAVTGGAVNVGIRVNGVLKFTATLNTGAPLAAFNTQLAGTFPVVQGDALSLTVDGAALVTAGALPLPVAINVVISNTLDANVLTLPDASNTQKGLTKLSVAAAVPTEPVVVGTNDLRVPTQDENNALVGTSGAPNAGNPYVTNTDARLTNSRVPSSHSLAGSEHVGVTLAALNLKITDTDVVDTLDPRLPTQDENDALVGTSGTAGPANKYVTDADARNTNARTPTAHALGGASHTADTFANLKTKVSDAVPAATDVSQQYTKNQRSAVVALTYAANITINADASNIFEVTLTNTTAQLDNPTGLVKGMAWSVIVHQDGSGGRLLTYDTQYDWGVEGAPDFTGQAASKSNVLSFLAISATQIAATALLGFT